MEIVHEKNHRSSANYRERTTRNCLPVNRLFLFFAQTCGSNPLEKGNGLRLIVDLQGKLIRFQAVDEMAFLIKDHDVGLDEFGVDPHDIVLPGFFRSGLGRDRRRDNQTEKNKPALENRLMVNEKHRANHGLLRRSFIVPLIRSASAAFGSSCTYFSSSSDASLFRCALKILVRQRKILSPILYR